MYNNRKINSDKVFDIFNTLLLIFISFVFVYPLIFVLSCSISNPGRVTNGDIVLLPCGIDFTAYTKIFLSDNILTGYGNTILYTVVGTLLSLLVTVMAAYPLSRKDLVGRKIFSLLMTITMFFSGGLIPTYLLIRKLGLLDNFWVIILPNLVSVMNIFIMRTFFESSIPEALFESAHIDGSSKIGILVKIVIPLSGPVIAVISLFYAVSYWNSYFNALLYLSDSKLFPLSLVLRDILTKNNTSTMLQTSGTAINDRELYGVSMKYACIVVASLPVLMLYPYLQRYFVKGVMLGAVKG